MSNNSTFPKDEEIDGIPLHSDGAAGSLSYSDASYVPSSSKKASGSTPAMIDEETPGANDGVGGDNYEYPQDSEPGEEVPPAAGSGLRQRRLFLAAAVILLIGAVVAGVSAIAVNNNDSDDSASSASSGFELTQTPVVSPPDANRAPVPSSVARPVITPTAAPQVMSGASPLAPPVEEVIVATPTLPPTQTPITAPITPGAPTRAPVVPTLAPTSAPITPAPTNPRTELDTVLNYLSQMGISDINDLTYSGNETTSGDPQYYAALWLAENDAANLPVPSIGANLEEDTDAYLYVVRYVMALLASGWRYSEWEFDMNFLVTSSVCEWNGVGVALNPGANGEMIEYGGLYCDDETGLPIKLDMEYNGMRGSMPTEIGMLTTLTYLDVEHNALTGSIPSEICELSQLEVLKLRDNQFTGPLPECMGSSMTNLRLLDVRENQFNGNLPQDICDWTEFRSLLVQDNAFSGPIPTCLGGMANLNLLMLSENAFTGTLPTQLGDVLPPLQYLDAASNQLSGNPVDTLNRLTQLQILYLGNNEFTGSVSDSFLSEANDLITLEMSHNQLALEGTTFPLHLLTHPNLTIVDLSYNEMQGQLPENIPVNEVMQLLSLNNNQLNGPIPSSIVNLAVRHLDLSHNDFTGQLPSSIFGNPFILNLFLGENPGLSPGPLPATLGSRTALEELSLKNTNRNGPLPLLISFDKLILLDLDNNDFSGSIPSEYGTELFALRYLLLNRNPQLSGPIPRMTNGALQTLLLDGTDIYGDFRSVCSAHAFNISTANYLPGKDHVVVQCNETTGVISNCECCHCCEGVESCSNPIVNSLDWTFRQEFYRLERDFQVNETLLLNPITPSDLD